MAMWANPAALAHPEPLLASRLLTFHRPEHVTGLTSCQGAEGYTLPARGHTESHGGRGKIVRMIMHSTHHQKFKGDQPPQSSRSVHASYYSAAAWFICSSCYVYLWIDSRSVSMPLRLNKGISLVCWRKEVEKEQWQKSE